MRHLLLLSVGLCALAAAGAGDVDAFSTHEALWASEWTNANDCSFRFRVLRYATAIGVEAFVLDTQTPHVPQASDCLEVFFGSQTSERRYSRNDLASAKKCFGTLWGGTAEPWSDASGNRGTHYRLWFSYACLNRRTPRLQDPVSFGFAICVKDDGEEKEEVRSKSEEALDVVELPGVTTAPPATGACGAIELRNGTATCLVDPLGGRIASCRLDGSEVFWNQDVAEDGLWRHGGVPLAWPWFGRLGEGDESIHGYAWKRRFDVVIASRDAVVLAIETESAVLEYEVRLNAGLRLAMRTLNRSSADFPVGMAFHPYFRVADRNQAVVEGVETRPLPCTNNIDRGVWFDCTRPRCDYVLNDLVEGRAMRISAMNSTGVNIWNPGAEKKCPGVILGDGWRNFVAIEPFSMGLNRFHVLHPGEWCGLCMEVKRSKK